MTKEGQGVQYCNSREQLLLGQNSSWSAEGSSLFKEAKECTFWELRADLEVKSLCGASYHMDV